jgi:winged helix-turn helix protein
MNVRYRVELSQSERAELMQLMSGGKHAARKLKRAQILLAADAGVNDEEIAASVGVGGSTVYRTKRRFVEGNLERALSEEPRPGAERKLTGKEEALLVATACSNPPYIGLNLPGRVGSGASGSSRCRPRQTAARNVPSGCSSRSALTCSSPSLCRGTRITTLSSGCSVT